MLSLKDELVERAVHSPVLTSYTAALDFLRAYDSDDFDDSDDEYNDLTRLTRQRSGKEQSKTRDPPKQPPEDNSAPAGSSRRTNVRQPVLWRTRRERLASPDVPVWKDGQQSKIALLRDWRDRLQLGEHVTGAPRPGTSGDRTTPKGATEKAGSEEEAVCHDQQEGLQERGEAAGGGLPLSGHPPSENVGFHIQTVAKNAETRGQIKKRKAQDLPDTNGSVNPTFRPKRGRPAKKERLEEHADGATREMPAPQGEEAQDGEVEAPKGRGRPKGSARAAKPADTVASTRSRRTKKP